MSGDREDKFDDGVLPPSPYDSAPTPEEELWFLPGPSEADGAVNAGSAALSSQKTRFNAWSAGEAHHYRALVDAAEAVARYGERLATLPSDVMERVALRTVSAVLRAEGNWIAPEQIALFRALRVGSQDQTRDLERASWAVRRLVAQNGGPNPLDDGMHAFLDRRHTQSGLPADSTAAPDRPVGRELEALGDKWIESLRYLGDLHPLTRAAYGLRLWQHLEVTPAHDLLEPMIACGLIGSAKSAPFLAWPEGRQLAALNSGDPQDRILAFYQAVQGGALGALMEMDRLVSWRSKARETTRDLSGRTPGSLIETALRFPVFSADLAARFAKCTPMSARRNLNLFSDRGLLREVTGQQRYRFWTARI